MSDTTTETIQQINTDTSSTSLLDAARNQITSIYINDIGDERLKTFLDELQKAERSRQTIIPIYINSFGGSASAMFGMIDAIQASPKPIATIVNGTAMSAAAALLAAGTKGYRYASPNSCVMIHEAISIAFGKASDVEAQSKHTKQLTNRYLNILDDACGRKRGYWKKRIKNNRNADLFLFIKQAKKAGLIDHIGYPRLDVNIQVETVLK